MHYGILGSHWDPPDMYGSREVLFVWRWPTPHPLGRRSQRGLWPGAPLLWQKTKRPLQYLPLRSLLSGAYRLKQRLRHFVEELRLRYVHSLSHLSATDDPQYAGVPTGEIKLPDTRLHHCRSPARRTAGRRVFNHACFTGPPRLVKSWWPLMTKGIAGVMKRNGPRGERIGGPWSSRWGRWRCNCREEIGTLSNERKGWKKGEGGAFPSGRGWSEAGTKSEFPSCDDHYMFLYNVQGCRHFTSRHSEITFSPPRTAVCSSSLVLSWVQFDASMLFLQSHAKEKC